MAIINSIISWYFKQRIKQIEQQLKTAADIQQEQLSSLLIYAQDTEWGKKYDFRSIKNYSDFKNRIPLQDYETLKPFIQRTMNGEQNILWPSEISWFAKSSGTTADKSKFLPVSYEALEDCHFRGGKDILTIHCNNFPNTKIFDGKGLLIGGSHKVNSLNENSYFGDLSAILMTHLPYWASLLKTPDITIALLDDWETKLDRMAKATLNDNVTNISGVPTWTLLLFEKMLEISGKQHMHEVWPMMELYIHGGVSFLPYRSQFEKLFPNNMRYMETYNASEGFFGIQHNPDKKEMLLMADYGIFYEFVPVEDLDSDNPRSYCLGEVTPGRNYAVVISTNAGLWRYMIGDTISFTGTNPYTFNITGRTKAFINAFGEELMVDNAEKAIAHACAFTGALVKDYTAAPVFMEQGQEAKHQWFFEFGTLPNDMNEFLVQLDLHLKEVNSDYESKRTHDIALKLPEIISVPEGTFYRWMKSKGKLGGQHKVPRLSNNRIIAEEMLLMLSGQRAEG